MSGYLVHFGIYVMAMLGLIFFAIFTYKFAYGTRSGLNTDTLSVSESMKLTPKKTLYVVNAGDERFLIASDMNSTTLISKLDNNTQKPNTKDSKRNDMSMKLNDFDGLKCMNDFISKSKNSNDTKKPVMKELIRKLQNI